MVECLTSCISTIVNIMVACKNVKEYLGYITDTFLFPKCSQNDYFFSKFQMKQCKQDPSLICQKKIKFFSQFRNQ